MVYAVSLIPRTSRYQAGYKKNPQPSFTGMNGSAPRFNGRASSFDHELIDKGNPMQAVINLVADLKETASKERVNLEDVLDLHGTLFSAFCKMEATQENLWKREMHAQEAIRLAHLTGRTDYLYSYRLNNYPTSRQAREFSEKEMKEWFAREGLVYRATGHKY